jgi:hypothetical protein
MKVNDAFEKLIELSEKYNETIVKIEKTMAVNNEILREINDQNKLHKQAIDINTVATREMTKAFSKIWYIFWAVIVALIVLAGAEKVLKFL